MNQLPIPEDRNAITYTQGFVQVVSDKDNGLLQGALQLKQLVLHLGANQWIERAERFVHQDDVRVSRQGPCQTHTLAHAA